MQDQKIRLQKMLADCGVASRRKAEELIQQGKVKVNGHVAQIGDKVNPKTDHVTVAGRRIVASRQYYYIMLHKPRGYVSTMSDEMGRKCVAELVKDIPARVYPVGRLDRDSEGLLLLTNDGTLVNALTHPRHEIEKHYEVRVRGRLDNIPRLEEPMEIDGYAIRPARVVILEQDSESAKLRLTIHEGRNRQIRKMCEQCGLEVRRLKRVAVGELPLDPALKAGAWRELTPEEVAYLRGVGAILQD